MAVMWAYNLDSEAAAKAAALVVEYRNTGRNGNHDAKGNEID